MKEDDKNLFRRQVGSVRRVPQDTVRPSRARPRPIPLQSRRDEVEVMTQLLADPADPHALETGEELVFARPGLSHAALRRLRRGEYSVSAELDLHGHTVNQARAALARFLQQSRGRNQTCVRIIHGKGLRSPGKRPVLKAKVHHWLRQRDEVVAAVSTPPVDGGTGAVYVLLKRGRR